MGLNGSPNGALAYTKFLFVIPRRDDDAAGTRLRAAGGSIARGFFNDYDVDGSRDSQSVESIQFLVRDEDPIRGGPGAPTIGHARYAVQVSSKYRPRLQEVDEELRRRLGDGAEIVTVNGAVRPSRYSSAEMHEYADRPAPARRTGRIARHAVIVPMSKSPEWWQLSPLERQTLFYPHVDAHTGCPVKGHVMAAEAGIPVLHRRMFHNPDGYQRAGEWDFIAYFECDDEGLGVFDSVLAALRDTSHNPEWRYVVEGPVWRGRRVLRW